MKVRLLPEFMAVYGWLIYLVGFVSQDRFIERMGGLDGRFAYTTPLSGRHPLELLAHPTIA